jgi:predicted acylesterase/phospholipase RssA
MSGAPGEQGLVGKRPRTDDEGLFLLSLDGGGVRGLSSLMVLKRIMEAIEPDNPPRPCDYFDMIGGTSTGGLIAIMLGRMRLTIDECITAYSELAPKAFAKVHHRINLRGEAQGRFDHVALQEGIKSLLKKNGFNPECLLKEPEGDSPCKVFVLFHQCAQCHKVDTPTDNYGNTSFVCATSQHASRPVVFSTYRNARRGNDWLHRVKIWEAARATSAATTFFEPLTIDGETFVDGATGANNPVNYLWSEAAEIWGDEGTLDPSRVHCLISIGTGFPAHASFGPNVASIAKALKVISTDTEVTANVFQKHHASLFDDGRAFRFNVPAGLEHVGLHEVDQWDQIKISTRAYMQVEDTLAKLGKCASILQLRHCQCFCNLYSRVTLLTDWAVKRHSVLRRLSTQEPGP